MPAAPILIMLAGPNGAGKSTFYDIYLRRTGLQYLNPDALSVLYPGITGDQLRTVTDALREQFFKGRASFITETVFSDTRGAKLDFLRRALAAGYDVRLIYIGLVSPVLSGKRVDSRVTAGGHDAPRHKLKSRFARSLANLEQALVLVPRITIYDNSAAESPYALVAEFESGRLTRKGPALRHARWFSRLKAVRRLSAHR